MSKQQQQNAHEVKGSSHPQRGRIDENDSFRQESLSDASLSMGRLRGLPDSPGAQTLRRQAILNLQRTHGNGFVMRHVMPRLQRQDDDQSATGTGESGAQELSNSGSIVRVTPGSVEISGGIVNVNAGMTNVNGLLKTNTLMADSVIASSYTPGAGNIW